LVRFGDVDNEIADVEKRAADKTRCHLASSIAHLDVTHPESPHDVRGDHPRREDPAEDRHELRVQPADAVLLEAPLLEDIAEVALADLRLLRLRRRRGH
jgi:hypothetical protein